MPQTTGAAQLLPYLNCVTHGDCIAVLASYRLCAWISSSQTHRISSATASETDAT